MLDVVTNSAQLMPTCHALNLSWGESSFVPRPYEREERAWYTLLEHVWPLR